MTRTALFFFVVLSAGLLAAAYFLGGFPIPALAALLPGAFWTVGLARRWKWIAIPGLFGVYALAVAGLLLGLSPALPSAASFAALLAWDLSDFTFRLRLAAPEDDTSGLERRHLFRLLVVAGIGAAVLVAAQTLRLEFSFEWLAVLLLFAVWGVGRIIGGLLKRKK
jgi:hypothetical protein